MFFIRVPFLKGDREKRLSSRISKLQVHNAESPTLPEKTLDKRENAQKIERKIQVATPP